MCGLGDLLGGPSQGEKTAAANSSKLESMYSADFATNYGEQQSALNDLNGMLNDLRQGKTGQGFGAQELAALNTQANEGVAQSYAKAQQQLNNTLAARGGGNVYLPTGGEDQLRAVLASDAAKTMSQEQLGITLDNYKAGRENFLNAISGKEALIRSYDPTAYGAMAQKQNAENFEQQKKLNEENQARIGRIFGTVTGIASSFIPGGAAFKAISGLKGLFSSGSSGPADPSGVGAAGADVAGPAGF